MRLGAWRLDVEDRGMRPDRAWNFGVCSGFERKSEEGVE